MTLDKAKALNQAKFGPQADSRGMSPSKPTSPATRPKITLVVKWGGPAEYYIFNAEQKTDKTFFDSMYPDSLGLASPWYPASFSVKTWTNRNNNSQDDYFYSTALVQQDSTHSSGNVTYWFPDQESQYFGGWQTRADTKTGIEEYELDNLLYFNYITGQNQGFFNWFGEGTANVYD
jgi:hypothetical protein